MLNRFHQSSFPGRFVLFLILGALAVLAPLGWLIPETEAATEVQGRQDFSPAPPRRLISLAPSAAEILYFLELGDRVVGVTSFCNYPPEVKEKPRIGTYREFNLEAILVLMDRPGPRPVDGMELLAGFSHPNPPII